MKTDNTDPAREAGSEMTLGELLAALSDRKRYFFWFIGAFAAVSLVISFTHKPGCSVACVLSTGSMGDSKPVKSPDDIVEKSLQDFPAYAAGRNIPGAEPADLRLWGNTFFMARSGPGLVRLSGRAYSASAAKALVSAAAGYIIDGHKAITDVERKAIRERIAELEGAVSAAARLGGRARGQEAPETVLSRTIAGWAGAELVTLRRQEKTVRETRILSGPDVNCTTKSFQVFFNLVLASLLGGFAALLVVLWLENWRYARGIF